MKTLKNWTQFNESTRPKRTLITSINNFFEYGILPFTKAEKDNISKKITMNEILDSIILNYWTHYNIDIYYDEIKISSDKNDSAIHSNNKIILNLKNNTISINDTKLYYSKNEIKSLYNKFKYKKYQSTQNKNINYENY